MSTKSTALTEHVLACSHQHLLISADGAQSPSTAQQGECDMTLSIHNRCYTNSHNNQNIHRHLLYKNI